MNRTSQHIDPISTLHMHARVQHISSGGMVLGFLPAFRDVETYETHLSVNADGSPAAVHLLDRIPGHWVTERDGQGRVVALKEGIVAGYIRSGQFLTRSELALMPFDA